MSTKAEQLLGTLIGKSPWSVWKGVGSFLLFEFGRKRKTMSRPKGTYTLWVYMAHWIIRRNGKQLAHSESPDKTIEKAARQFERRKLLGITLKKHIAKDRILFGAMFRFDGGHSLDAIMYEDEDHSGDAVFMIYTPTHLLQFDYGGDLALKKMEGRKASFKT